MFLGHQLFTRPMKLHRDVPDGDLWTPVVSLGGVRFMYSRSTAYRRPTETIDMITGYVQTVLCCCYRVFILFDRETVELLKEIDDEISPGTR